MRPVTILVMLPPRSALPETPLGWLEAAREMTAERHREAFGRLGATEVRIVREPPDGRSFGQRLRELVTDLLGAAPGGSTSGLVVLGGGAMPLARADDLEPFLATALARAEGALANSYYSADAIAVPDARLLLQLPDLPSDNALPRWLTERAGVPVADLRERPWLTLDLDSPLDVLLVARDQGCSPELTALARNIAAANPAVMHALDGLRAVLDDRRAQVIVAGRTSSGTLQWLERNASCRVRALIEERGLRASSPLALGNADIHDDPTAAPDRVRARADRHVRPPRSMLGLLLDTRGPDALDDVLAELGDAAVVDTRVLLAHRCGAAESGWPSLADRLSSDLLRADEVADPWLRALTKAAANSAMPILLGGHTLVGPGLPLIGRRARSARQA